jgi:PAS domain S-box-containing protein
MPTMHEPARNPAVGAGGSAGRDEHASGPRLRTLAALSRVVSSSLETGEVLGELARAAATLMHATFASFSLADEVSRTLEVGGVSDPVVGADIPARRHRFDEGLVGWVATHRRPLDVPDLFGDPRVSAPEFCRRHGLTSFYGLPIVLDGALLGVLALTARAPFRVTADDHELLELLVAQAAVAIRNARRHEEVAKRLRQSEIVVEVTQRLATSLDATEIARRAARAVTRSLGADTSIFFELDETGDHGVPVAGYRVPPSLLGPSYHIALRSLPAIFTETGRPVATADVASDPRLDHPAIRRWPLLPRSLLYVPVVLRGRMLGALVTCWWTASRPVTDDEIRVVVAVGQQLVLAYENARLYDDAEFRRREAETIAGVADSINASLDLEVIVQRMIDGVRSLCQADSALLALRDPMTGAITSRAWAGVRREKPESVRIAPGQGTGGQVLLTRRPFRTHNYLEDRRISRDFAAIAEGEGLVAQLVVPVELGDVVEGLLYVSRRSPRAFTGRDEAALVRLAGYVALAIRQARQSAREQESRARVEASEQALGESAERFRSITEAAPDAVIVGDRDGNIVSWNRGAETMFGYAEHEVLGRPLSMLMPERYRQAHQAGFGRFMGGGESRLVGRTVELHGVKKDGSEFPLELSLATWTTTSGRFVSGILRDVTERARAEEALRQSEEHLRHAQKMEAVGRLAGGIAHDFNNLLTVIRGRSEILVARTAATDLRHQAEIISQSAERAAVLTKRLLAFSRKQVLEAVPLDLGEVVQGMTMILRGLLGESVEFSFRPGPALGMVMADRGQLEQVIVNLVANARDAMPGGGRLHIQTDNVRVEAMHALRHPELRPGAYVALTVTDSGCGMTEEVKAHIFEPFFTTKTPDKGTGLGLATAYGVIKQSGGDIIVDSRVDRGTTFTIYLPRTDDAAGADRAESAEGVLAGGTETILVVEDEPEVADLLDEVLTECGYVILRAERPTQGLALSERYAGTIDLLLTDVVMPEMSGPELADCMAMHRPGMAVLYMSGYSDATLAAHGELTPGSSLLPKPFTAEELASRVRAVLDSHLRRA